jgi:hypothetical protein
MDTIGFIFQSVADGYFCWGVGEGAGTWILGFII